MDAATLSASDAAMLAFGAVCGFVGVVMAALSIWRTAAKRRS